MSVWRENLLWEHFVSITLFYSLTHSEWVRVRVRVGVRVRLRLRVKLGLGTNKNNIF